MRRFLMAIVAGFVACGVSLAQDAAQSPNSAAPNNGQSAGTGLSAQPGSGRASASLKVAPGSIIPVELTKGLNAKKAKTGDKVDARVTQDLKTEKGEIIVPKDTKVVGHVTEVQARNKEQKESELGLAFDHVVTKNGDAPLPMSVQAIIAPPASNPGANSGNPASESPGPGPGGMPSGGGPVTGMGRGSAPQAPGAPAAGDWPTDATRTNAHSPEINDKTQGVVGISNLKLSAGADKAQGSVVSSDKTNVKLESGTLMLLRVNP